MSSSRYRQEVPLDESKTYKEGNALGVSNTVWIGTNDPVNDRYSLNSIVHMVPEYLRSPRDGHPGEFDISSTDLLAYVKTTHDSDAAKWGAQQLADRIATISVDRNCISKQRTRSMTDSVIPNYKVRSAKGEVFFSPMQSTKQTFAATSSDSVVLEKEVEYTFLKGSMSGSTTFGILFEIPWSTCESFGIDSDLITEIKNRAVLPGSVNSAAAINDSHARMSEGDMSLLISLGEGHKTAKHLASTVSRLAALLRALKKGNFSKLAPKTFKRWREAKPGQTSPTLDFISDAWLEARFAWRPLIIDAQKAIEYAQGERLPRRTYRGSDASTEAEQGDFTYTNSGYTYEVSYTHIQNSTARAGVMTELSSNSSGISRDLGLTNFGGLIWELIPYSFVAGWFLNVSGIIAAMNPVPGSAILGSWLTERKDASLTGVVSITSPRGVVKNIDFQYSITTQDRTIGTQPTLLTIDVDFNASNLLDSLALLRRWM